MGSGDRLVLDGFKRGQGDRQHLSISNPLGQQGACSLPKERPVMKMKRRSILMPWRMHQLLSL